ncbi:glycosyltransferase family 2 protein [Enterococcus sp. DIV0756]|uniref:glycosyltransferase family 2 protein n=1 Tax=Enterococcus sp. DIV0756 TaxID=2774636 RepID=UPI003F1FA62B
MCEISIIVTVYNSEKYLNKTIESILNQTFRDFELILVDDGSTDSSGKICDDYAREDNRIRVLHQKNGGVSCARNKGIEISNGEFIGFVDSDDFIDPDMYELLLHNLKKEEAELSICGIYDVYEGKEVKRIDQQYFVVNRDKAVKLILEAKIISVHPVNKLYKKLLFENVSYPEGSITEDGAVMLYLLENVSKVVIDTSQKYYYYHRENSITTKAFSMIDLKTIEVWQNNEKYIKKNYPQYNSIAHTRVCWAHLIVLDKLLMGKKEFVSERNEIVSFLRRNFCFIMKNEYFTRNRKISVVLLMLNINLYKLVSYLEYSKNKSKNS